MNLEMLKNTLESKNFVSLCTDSSNKGNIKLLPVMVRYYSVDEGIQTKLITLSSLGNETGESVFNAVKFAVDKFELRSKFICFGADRCPTNFGGINRGGDQNVFARMRVEFPEHELIGSECNAHIVHTTADTACHKFQSFFDIEAIVVKIYSYFKHITARNTKLQQLFSNDVTDQIKLLGYSNTRFIGFKGCIDRILKYFDALSEYFGNEDDAPLQLLQFFNHKLSKLLLIFVRDQCHLFESTIKSIEGSSITAFEAAKSLKWLLEQIESRREEKYESFDLQCEMEQLSPELPFNDTILVRNGKRAQFEQITVDESYLQEMFSRFYGKYSSF